MINYSNYLLSRAYFYSNGPYTLFHLHHRKESFHLCILHSFTFLIHVNAPIQRTSSKSLLKIYMMIKTWQQGACDVECNPVLKQRTPVFFHIWITLKSTCVFIKLVVLESLEVMWHSFDSFLCFGFSGSLSKVSIVKTVYNWATSWTSQNPKSKFSLFVLLIYQCCCHTVMWQRKFLQDCCKLSALSCFNWN